ncbi:hypothetical protein [Paenibacillus sp. FSL L8-0708]|uniref:hypothetical protein n=1 Tax=Paenibacillus sp. FSL L8-0708 TaxID=2975311 RepID=UPI0030FB647C
MTRYKWYFYSFCFSANGRDGCGNGVIRFKTIPNINDWRRVSENIEKENEFPVNTVLITNYQSITK